MEAQRTQVSPELMVYISVYFAINHTCKYEPLPIIKAHVCFSVPGIVSSNSKSGKERGWEEELTPALSSAKRWKVKVVCAEQTPLAVAGKISALPMAPYFPFTLCYVDKRPRQRQQRRVGSGVWFAESI